MVGKGPLYYAIWGYVISHFLPDAKVGAQVELNAKVISFLIGGCSEEEVGGVIQQMCDPDPESRSGEMEGRKLVRLGPFDYQVVNGMKYRAIRNEEKRRQQNREAQERFRSKRKKETPVTTQEKQDAKTFKRIHMENSGPNQQFPEL